MSLIDEALKRARLEAARRDAEQRGKGFPLEPWLAAPVLPERREPGRAVVWGVAAGVVALAVLCGAAFFLGRQAGPRATESASAPGPAGSPRGAVAAPRQELGTAEPPGGPGLAGAEGAVAGAAASPALQAPAAVASPGPASGEPDQPGEDWRARAAAGRLAAAGARERFAGDGGAAQPAGAAAQVGGGERGEPPSGAGSAPLAPIASPMAGGAGTPRPLPGRPAAASDEGPDPPAPATPPYRDPAENDDEVTDPGRGIAAQPSRREPQPAPAGPAAAPEDGKTYRRTLSFPDGLKLELSGIAYSAAQPVAVINGKVVGPGDTVTEFTVTQIQPSRVALRGRGLNVFLSLK